MKDLDLWPLAGIALCFSMAAYGCQKEMSRADIIKEGIRSGLIDRQGLESLTEDSYIQLVEVRSDPKPKPEDSE
ncbi:MAG: hypothetical protein AAGG48_14645 [Planctomycetota bacterium]